MRAHLSSATMLAASTTEQTFPESLDELVASMRTRENMGLFGKHFRRALSTAAEDPAALYRFFQLYSFLNAGIASVIASLVGTISQSRATFVDASVPVRDEADYAFEVAERIKKASVDEYADPQFRDTATGQGVSHRLLAIGVMKSVGDYAGLSTEERNAFEIPSWLQGVVDRMQRVYSGKKNDRKALARAVGAHIFSEFSADEVEFNFACQELFIDRRDRGFHAHIQNSPMVTVQGQTFFAHSWLRSHGGYDAEKGAIIHGVEYTHLLTGYDAARLIYEKAPLSERAVVAEGLQEGIHAFRGLLDNFFIGVKRECEQVIAARRGEITPQVAGKGRMRHTGTPASALS